MCSALISSPRVFTSIWDRKPQGGAARVRHSRLPLSENTGEGTRSAPARRQRGAVLIVSLLMLIAATMLTLTAINNSTISLKIVRNAELGLEAEAVAQEVLEEFLENTADWPNSTGQTVNTGSYQVTLEAPKCLYELTDPGGSSADIEATDNPYEQTSSVWEIVAEAEEIGMGSGARIRVHQCINWDETYGAVNECPD